MLTALARYCSLADIMLLYFYEVFESLFTLAPSDFLSFPLQPLFFLQDVCRPNLSFLFCNPHSALINLSIKQPL